MLSALFLLNGNLCALYFHLCLCCAHPNVSLFLWASARVFVCSSTYSRVQVVRLIYPITFRPSLTLHALSLSLTHFNSWLFTLLVQKWSWSCIVGEVWPQRLNMCVFRILTFECNAMQSLKRAKENGITYRQFQKRYKYICCLYHILVYMHCPKPAKKNLYISFWGSRMGIYECQSSPLSLPPPPPPTVYGIRN